MRMPTDLLNNSNQKQRKIVVIVEDNENIAELIKQAITSETDYQALAVNNGSRALEIIRSVKPNLVLLDVMLPGMNGFQIYDAIKSDLLVAAIPIIFITATRHTEEFKKRNIEQIISKPFNVDYMLARVVETLQPS